MDVITIYKLATPSVLGMPLLINFFYWRFRDEEVTVRTCFWGWVWFISSALIGEGLAHLFYPSAYEGMGHSSAQIFGFLVALILSPFVGFSCWAITRRLVHVKRKRRKAEDRARLKGLRKAANKMIKDSEDGDERSGGIAS